MNSAVNYRQRRHRAIYAMVGALKRAGVDGEEVKEALALAISGGRTGHSSALTEAEHRALRDELQRKCIEAGIQNTEFRRQNEKVENQGTQSQIPQGRNSGYVPGFRHVPGFSRLPKGVARLRSPKQERTIRQLGRHQGLSDDAIEAALKQCPTAAQARAEIEKRKSQLVRGEELIEKAGALYRDAERFALLSDRERALVTDVLRTAARGGRAVNRLAIGAVLWLHDLLKGMEKS